MFRKMLSAALGAACLLAPVSASAHFQLVYVAEANLTKAGEVPVEIIFWHPMEGGPVMDMALPQEFYAVHRGKKMDLKDTLKPITFSAGDGSTASAFTGTLPVKRPGDYVLVVVPAPYLEKSEDSYIQQFAKSYVNLNQLPTDWQEPQGLVTEIVPLNRPNNIITGSTFSGRVLREGKPAAGIEVEVEYMAAEPVHGANKPGPATAAPMPGGTLVAITNENGEFTFGIPKAGYWGFAALGSGPATTHEGKGLSQDAVIWIRADDLPKP